MPIELLQVLPAAAWQCGAPLATRRGKAADWAWQRRLPPRQLGLSAGSTDVPTFRDASLVTPAPPHPRLLGPGHLECA